MPSKGKNAFQTTGFMQTLEKKHGRISDIYPKMRVLITGIPKESSWTLT